MRLGLKEVIPKKNENNIGLKVTTDGKETHVWAEDTYLNYLEKLAIPSKYKKLDEQEE